MRYIRRSILIFAHSLAYTGQPFALGNDATHIYFWHPNGEIAAQVCSTRAAARGYTCSTWDGPQYYFNNGSTYEENHYYYSNKKQCKDGYQLDSSGIACIPKKCSAQSNIQCIAGNANRSNSNQCSTSNPVNIYSGSKFFIEKDFISNENSFLYLKRSYDSKDGKWLFNIAGEVLVDNGIFAMYVIHENGSSSIFRKNGTEWTSDTPSESLIQDDNGWVFKNKNIEKHFDNKQRLILKRNLINNDQLTISYVDTNTVLVSSGKETMELTVDEQTKNITSVKLPNTYQVLYSYDSESRLVSATINGLKTEYLYESSQFENGITSVISKDGKKYKEITYHADGRVKTSSLVGGYEKVTLEFHNNNATTVTNPLGKKTTYYFEQFNGVNKVVKVEGHQSENCAAANKEYTYYPTGLLKTKTDWKGNTTEFKYNEQGLQVEKTEAVGTPQARTIKTEWDVEKRLPLKSSDGKLETLYQYDEQGKLASKKQVSQ
ncbi:hypothetical protein H0A36_28870 [Endozoicomonas sp. SM1973]|uniref:RHS repeat protein n=2 Tax=Spartinivicinus marinus TaxID=2994442 RepID=A0A853IIY3_9GAMM|nr:hypothetical protein [Spartinivicinus marinus]